MPSNHDVRPEKQIEIPLDLIQRLPTGIFNGCADAKARSLEAALRWAWLEGYGDRLADERAEWKSESEGA